MWNCECMSKILAGKLKKIFKYIENSWSGRSLDGLDGIHFIKPLIYVPKAIIDRAEIDERGKSLVSLLCEMCQVCILILVIPFILLSF